MFIFWKEINNTALGQYLILFSVAILLLLGPFINIGGIILSIIYLVKTKKKKRFSVNWFAISSLILAAINILMFFYVIDEFFKSSFFF